MTRFERFNELYESVLFANCTVTNEVEEVSDMLAVFGDVLACKQPNAEISLTVSESYKYNVPAIKEAVLRIIESLSFSCDSQMLDRIPDIFSKIVDITKLDEAVLYVYDNLRRLDCEQPIEL